MTEPIDAAERLLEKVRAFTDGLPPDERALFAALIAPGVAMATTEPEVAAFGLAEWMPTSLPERLAERIRDRNVEISGL